MLRWNLVKTRRHSPVSAMRRGSWLTIVPTLALPAVILLGFVSGRYSRGITGLFPGQLAFLAGAVLALAGLFQKSAPDGSARGRRFAAAGLIAYVVIVGIVEPFGYVGDASGVLVSVAWLFPLILGGVLLPSRGCWRAGSGCWSILFSGTLALSYNVSHVHSGMGFLIRWLE
jgi:hypothetical protein